MQRSLLVTTARRAARTGALRRTIYTAEQTSRLPGRLVRGENSSASNDVAVDEAYEFAGDVYRFYEQILSRRSIDGEGLRLDSSVHFREDPGEPFDNAFWNGEQMVYGDGDEIIFTRFTRSLDVIAHELTHGVTQYEADLDYHNQSGALNEHFSDAMGSMVKQWKRGETVEQADWLIGKELMLIPGALRSMKAPGTGYDDPRLGGADPQPDRMSKYVPLADTRRGDSGGVHINSGIPNRAFYLSCVNLGAQHSWEKAGKIWYTTLCNRLGSTATFADAAQATIAVANEMFGTKDAEAVLAAWQEVEVLPRPSVVAMPSVMGISVQPIPVASAMPHT
jgi:Zn-dependent metalloprotease